MLQMSGAALCYVPISNYDHASACKPTDARDIRLLTIASFVNEALSFGTDGYMHIYIYLYIYLRILIVPPPRRQLQHTLQLRQAVKIAWKKDA